MMDAKLKRLSVYEAGDGSFELRAEWTNGRNQIVRIELFDNVEDRLMRFADYIRRDRKEGLLEQPEHNTAWVQEFIRNTVND